MFDVGGAMQSMVFAVAVLSGRPIHQYVCHTCALCW